MPGMMDTILNLGLNETSLQGLIKQTANERFAYDAYRRFIQLFGKIALGIADEHFDERMAAIKRKYGARLDLDLDAEHLKELAGEFLDIVKRHTGKPFPQDPYEQLEIAVGAVFRSWMGKRAVDYRKQFKITQDMANGTAVNVCTMVFGNMGNDSGTGVGFTRNPGTGENVIYGEYLVNAQGEDVVAGIRTPKPIAELEQEMPEIYRQLMELHNRLESHYHEVQDFEFTIEKGTLYCLQTRNGKMNARAMVRTSVEMFDEGLISKERALLRVEPAMLEQLLVPQLSPDFHGKSLAQGLPASPGAASGKIVFDANTAEARGMRRRESDPGARGNQAGGHPRLLPGAGHPHQPRRQDLARRGGGARHGQALRLRLRADRDQRQGAQRDHRRDHPARRRRHHHRRRHRPRLRRRSADGGGRRFPRKWSRCSPGRTRWRG